MGLDSYLRILRHTNDARMMEAIAEAVNTPIPTPNGFAGGVEVKIPLLYWRKNWAIHRWFVHHVQNDEDDCGTYEISSTELVKLRDDLHTALKYPATAEKLFGEDWLADHDWFVAEMEATRAALDREIARIQNTQLQQESYTYYEYHSSW